MLAGDDAPYTMMGASFLAAQELTPESEQKFKPDSNWPTIYEHTEAEYTAAKSWRYSWWVHWGRLAEFFKPRRIHWFVTPNRMARGTAINDAILDGSPAIAVNICSSGMWSGLTNPARPWFGVEPQNPTTIIDAESQEWLDDLEQVTMGVMEKSNFYSIMAQAFEDVVVFGTAPIICYEDDETIVRFYLPCAGEYFLKLGARFSIDTLIREYLLNVQQLVEMFGFDNCPGEIQNAFRQGGSRLAEEYVVCHLIEPNFALVSKDGGKKNIEVVPGTFTFRELYWLRGIQTERPLSRRGFNDTPFFTLLWSRVSNDPYGRSPCMDALGDNKQLQRQTLRKDEFLEKLVNPPMGADPELKNEPSSMLPGMKTYVNTAGGKKGFFPLFEVQAAAIKPMEDGLEKVSQRIDKALFVDVFMAITNMQGVEPRNELELTKRDLERLQRLGPVIELVENSMAEAIKRIMHVIERRKMLKPMPKQLQAGNMKIGFESINRLAQRAAESMAMKDTFQTLGELSSAAKAAAVPDPIRNFNLDKAAKKYAMANGYPSDAIYTDQEVAQHDQARQAAIKAAQQPQALMAGVNAAKTLSETQVPGGNALGAILGGGQGQ